MSLPITIFLSIFESVAVVGSLSILCFRKSWSHRHSIDTLPLKTDTQRDTVNKPFSDAHRLKRIILDAFILSLTATFMFVVDIRSIESSVEGKQETIYAITSSAITFTTCIYTLVLALTSLRFPLPNRLGWLLNIHLFVVCLTLFSASVGILINSLWRNPDIDFIRCFPLFLPLVFAFDLVCITGTTKRGPPFLDENGKRVTSSTVESIVGILLFNWMTPIVTAAASKDKDFTDADLPTLPTQLRAYNLFYIFGDTRGEKILYRIFCANKLSILVQTVLAIANSCAVYASPFFLNKLLNLIQEDSSGKDNSRLLMTGLGYLLAMVVFSAAQSLLRSQLDFEQDANARVKTNAMICVDIYRKTLCCMDSSILSNVKSRNVNEPENSNSDNKNDNKVKYKEIEGEKEPEELDAGRIYNLMSNDSPELSRVFVVWTEFVSTSIEMVLGIYFLYTLLGWSSFVGLFFIIVTIPISQLTSNLWSRNHNRLRKVQDKRISLVNETLQGIRQIKFFAWESRWTERLMKVRKEEVVVIKQRWFAQLLMTFLWQVPPLLVTVVSFWSFTKIQGHELSAAIAFTSIAVFGQLSSCLCGIPDIVSQFSTNLVNIKRLERYLNESELQQPVSIDATSGSTSTAESFQATPKVRIGFENATITWPSIQTPSKFNKGQENGNTTSDISSESTYSARDISSFNLRGLNIIFPNKKLSLICGPTGSGKTLLMLSLLGETQALKGFVFCPNSTSSAIMNTNSVNFEQDSSAIPDNWILEHAVAYVSQKAWLQNATIRDNILFGLPCVDNRYKATINACALDQDLTFLDDGDLTEIGEKGITLSGGQKARVALARAVYSRAQNVLMDDILSAVDAHTAKHIYEKCLMGPLMQNRTQILITHHINLCIQGSAYIVYIDYGEVGLSGSPEELRQKDQLYQICEHNLSMNEAGDEKSNNEDIGAKHDTAKQINKQKGQAPNTLIEKEIRSTGTVNLKIYQFYLGLISNWVYWVALSALIFSDIMTEIASKWWLSVWTRSYENSSNGTAALSPSFAVEQSHVYAFTGLNETSYNSSYDTAYTTSKNEQSSHSLNYYIIMYAAIKFSTTFVFLLRYSLTMVGSISAGTKIYRGLIDRLLHAPLRYYDITPVGRIINRLSGDFGTVDQDVLHTLAGFCVEWVDIFSTVAALAFSVPTLTVPIVLIAGFLNMFFNPQFIGASRELSRMSSVNRSPLYTIFDETIAGITTIRAFGMAQYFMTEMLNRVDNSIHPRYYSIGCNRWIGARVTIMDAAVTLATGVLILLNIDHIDAATAGFCFTFILSFTSKSAETAQLYGILETCFTAVERVAELLEIEQEAPSITDIRPPKDWPSKGVLEVRNLHVNYAPGLETVLKGITFSVNPEEKIGIVGRTGSGKSTLALCFYRFIEVLEGSITIDGINIADIGTEDLRSNLATIPQDPVLFSGTLRSNMDPFDQFTDEEIFVAFRRVRLLKQHYSEENIADQDYAFLPNTSEFKIDWFDRFTEEEIHTVYEKICQLKESLEGSLDSEGFTLVSSTCEPNINCFDQFSAKEMFTTLRIFQHLNKPKEEEYKKRSIWPSITFLTGSVHNSNTPKPTDNFFDQFTKEEKLAAFNIIQLLNEPAYNQNVFKNLNTSVREKGNNFSQGQKQLLCLARALLHRKKIVIMDEATASVDFETDRAIQETILAEFTNSTVLCIAHRLHTVIEYDRILVLDHGKVMEFANPLELIRDSNSIFHQMCRKSGEFEILMECAKVKHELVDTSL